MDAARKWQTCAPNYAHRRYAVDDAVVCDVDSDHSGTVVSAVWSSPVGKGPPSPQQSMRGSLRAGFAEIVRWVLVLALVDGGQVALLGPSSIAAGGVIINVAMLAAAVYMRVSVMGAGERAAREYDRTRRELVSAAKATQPEEIRRTLPRRHRACRPLFEELMTGSADPDDPMVIRRAAVDELYLRSPADTGCDRRRFTVAPP